LPHFPTLPSHTDHAHSQLYLLATPYKTVKSNDHTHPYFHLNLPAPTQPPHRFSTTLYHNPSLSYIPSLYSRDTLLYPSFTHPKILLYLILKIFHPCTHSHASPGPPISQYPHPIQKIPSPIHTIPNPPPCSNSYIFTHQPPLFNHTHPYPSLTLRYIPLLLFISCAYLHSLFNILILVGTILPYTSPLLPTRMASSPPSTPDTAGPSSGSTRRLRSSSAKKKQIRVNLNSLRITPTDTMDNAPVGPVTTRDYPPGCRPLPPLPSSPKPAAALPHATVLPHNMDTEQVLPKTRRCPYPKPDEDSDDSPSYNSQALSSGRFFALPNPALPASLSSIPLTLPPPPTLPPTPPSSTPHSSSCPCTYTLSVLTPPLAYVLCS
jgi:hypothetical protein